MNLSLGNKIRTAAAITTAIGLLVQHEVVRKRKIVTTWTTIQNAAHKCMP